MEFLNPIKDLTKMKIRALVLQVVVLGTIISSALMMWKGLMLVMNSESPVVVVLT
jgi:signal peptidase I